MKQKYAVMVIEHKGLQGEVYEFDSFQEANRYAKVRRELIDMYYPVGSITNLFRPRVVISPLNDLRKEKKQLRCNELNAKMTNDIQRRMEKTYMRQIRKKLSQRDMEIVNCYEKAGLANSLYNCLTEEDESRFRESVQNLADNILNEEVMPTLCDIGYVF